MPAAMEPNTTMLPQPNDEALEKPYNKPPKAMVERATETRSSFGFLSSPTFFSMKMPRTNTANAKGTIAPIIVRQP